MRTTHPHNTPRLGKSDPIDAHLAVLSDFATQPRQLPTPRADRDREALRILLRARQELTTTATGQTNRLRALLRDGDDTDRRLPAPASTALAGLARRRQPAGATREQTVRHGEIRRLTRALREAARALKTNRAELAAIVNDVASGLPTSQESARSAPPGPSSGSPHAGRSRNDVAFANLAGTSPLEASSGQTTRHRLNRSRDRALNKAIHIIANTRMRNDPRTQAYLVRRRAEGNPTARSGAASSDISPASSTAPSPPPWTRTPRPTHEPTHRLTEEEEVLQASFGSRMGAVTASKAEGQRVVLGQRTKFNTMVPFHWSDDAPTGLNDVEWAEELGAKWEGDELVTYDYPTLTGLLEYYEKGEYLPDND